VRCPYRFIVLDGVDGAGKSTQLARLAEALRDAGEDVVVTVEPGGTSVGEAVRALLLSPDHPEMTPLTEALLFCASRAQHVIATRRRPSPTRGTRVRWGRSWSWRWMMRRRAGWRPT